ncbi:MAG: ImmA/IrrE family metallo-endopeptidase [Clostridiales bacterium]|nr:ImmA/IrrE family metallo-endopeptidase [Clostridiales bacterium]
MDIQRFRKIIEYSRRHKENVESKIKSFYSFAGMSRDKEVLNLMQIVRPALKKKGYFVFKIPLSDDEIGALCYKGDVWGYIVLNTSLPKININFAICHELYHVFFQKNALKARIEFSGDSYYNQEEFEANLFASMFLMPEDSFRFMYEKFKNESEGDEKDTILRLMNYYEVPYMAALLRCYELNLPDNTSIPEELLYQEKDKIRERFIDLWLDESILKPTKKNDYTRLENMAAYYGEKCLSEGYLSERALRKSLQNMRTLYSEIKGE